jgi:hypothetical protein
MTVCGGDYSKFRIKFVLHPAIGLLPNLGTLAP